MIKDEIEMNVKDEQSIKPTLSLPPASIDQFPVTDTLLVPCFDRDGREPGVGRGPLFIVREWDLKVIRTIGHKPKCKGPNQEQALRACVRQGVLSMSLKTENATKDEIQTLKAVGQTINLTV